VPAPRRLFQLGIATTRSRAALEARRHQVGAEPVHAPGPEQLGLAAAGSGLESHGLVGQPGSTTRPATTRASRPGTRSPDGRGSGRAVRRYCPTMSTAARSGFSSAEGPRRASTPSSRRPPSRRRTALHGARPPGGLPLADAGDTGHVRELSFDDVSRIHLTGGSALGTARDNPPRSQGHAAVVATLATLGVTQPESPSVATTRRCRRATSGAPRRASAPPNVPRPSTTICPARSRADVRLPDARHVGAEAVRALSEDARSTRRWYVVGRWGAKAGHLALGIGKAPARRSS